LSALLDLFDLHFLQFLDSPESQRLEAFVTAVDCELNSLVSDFAFLAIQAFELPLISAGQNVIASAEIFAIFQMDESVLFRAGIHFGSPLSEIRALILFRLSNSLLFPPLKSLMDSVAERRGIPMDFADFELDRVSENLDFSAQRTPLPLPLPDSDSAEEQNSLLFALFGINANEMVAGGAPACGFVHG
jgi:hypothetical protein